MRGLFSAGDVIHGRYKIIDYVGEGGMQFVYAARDRVLKRKVALKTPKNNSAKKRFHRSAIVSACINHPNVAKTLDYLEDENGQYLVEELIEGTDLDKAFLKKTKALDPYLAARVFHYLAKGLAASHHAGVIHRDLKPTNVMVADGFQLSAIKITDFGIAKMADEEIAEAVEGGDESISASSTVVGALPYMAPEAIDSPREVGKPADVWSIGAMMFELLTGEKPYGSGLKAVAKIQEAKPPVFPVFLTTNPQFSPLAEKLKQLVLQCLQKDPNSRPDADALVALCGDLCYPVEPRLFGSVREIRHKAWGFINVNGADVFFHLACVYGERPAVGDRVMLSKFPGGGGVASASHSEIDLNGGKTLGSGLALQHLIWNGVSNFGHFFLGLVGGGPSNLVMVQLSSLAWLPPNPESATLYCKCNAWRRHYEIGFDTTPSSRPKTAASGGERAARG